MKFYIAGKISGDPDYVGKFFEAAEALRAKGHIVLNPATLPEGMEKAEYARICLPMLDTADVVCFLPGWEDSDGARLEREYCRYCGKPYFLFTFESDLPVSNLDTTVIGGGSHA